MARKANRVVRIMAGDLIGTKARLLLMLGLAKYGNDTVELGKLFAR